MPGAGVFAPAGAVSGASGADPTGAPRTSSSLIERFRLEGPTFQAQEGEDAKPLSLWLPAGSHAEAMVIAGVDASAGVASQGDPRPVLLRVTGPAWTAAEDGTARAVDLDGCTVTAAAYGDLSSEKVYARLRTLTCTGTEPGTVVETEVAGFVAGSGKAGGARGPRGEPPRGRWSRRRSSQAPSPASARASRARSRRRRWRPARAARRSPTPGSTTSAGRVSARALPARGARSPTTSSGGRAVPAGDPAPGRHGGHRGVPRGHPARRPARRQSPTEDEYQ